MKRRPMVSSFSATLKKAMVTEDVEQAKKEHRQSLRTLVDKYMEDVSEGRAEGIRNAKDLVEVIKADLLLMGEASERSETNQNVDEVKMAKVSAVIDPDDPAIKELMDTMFAALNNANDEEDTNS